jgi:hypothetical protein
VPALIYWVLLVLVIALLAYASLFSLFPFVFLAGGVLIGLMYSGFLTLRYRKSGNWEHSKFQFRFHGVLFTYIVVFWTVVGIFTNVKEQRQFWARYEPYVSADGNRRGFTFHYLDYPGAWERVDSAELTRYLDETQPERVRLIIETTRDFGKLRAYAVQGVEGFSVNEAWSGGNPPWDELRRPGSER